MQEGQPTERTTLQAMKASGQALYRGAVSLAASRGYREGPRAVGRRFMSDNGAQANPVTEVAVGFILIGVALIVALTFLPSITGAVETAATDGNITATQATLLRLLPTLLIVGLIAGGVVFLFQGFKKIQEN